MEDQETCDFWFKITPTDIIPNGKPKTNTAKSILIKLGNKQAKCKSIGNSIQLNVEVLYSKALNKFCPIKGIIKVYDVSKDGAEMISCVGAFNTEGLLSEQQKTTNLQRDIGPCKIYLTIQVKKLKNLQILQKKDIRIKEPQKINKQTEAKVLTEGTSRNLRLRSIDKKFSKSPRVSPKVSQTQFFEPTPYIMDDSSDFTQQIAKSKCSEKSDQLQKNQRQALGQQLIEQRRKNKLLEDKIQKNNIKLQLLRKKLLQKNSEIKIYCQNFKSFTNGLDTDSKGQYIFQMNQRKREVTLRYKANIKFKEIFQDFIAFMIKKMMQNGASSSSEINFQQQGEISKVLSNVENFELEKRKIEEQNNKLTSQISKIKIQLNQRSIQLSTKESILRKKVQEINFTEEKFKQSVEERKSLQAMNQYLQQRDSQLQSIIIKKQRDIELLEKRLAESNAEMQSLQTKNDKLISIINNLELRIEQMKQQISDLSQTIEGYRQKYGDLKSTKDKTLQRQLKQCLRWIDQQNRDEQLNFEDQTMQNSETLTVNSIIKSIGEIQNMPLEEIAGIRKQVINVLKRLDEFMAKNNISGVSQ